MIFVPDGPSRRVVESNYERRQVNEDHRSNHRYQGKLVKQLIDFTSERFEFSRQMLEFEAMVTGIVTNIPSMSDIIGTISDILDPLGEESSDHPVTHTTVIHVSDEEIRAGLVRSLDRTSVTIPNSGANVRNLL